jgi:hypothetical protein
MFSCSQNPHSVQKIVVLLVLGITSTVLSLPPSTSAIENPDAPIAIPFPPDPSLLIPSSSPDLPPSIDLHLEEAAALYSGIPFITHFSHACPTRAPGDANRMHSVLNTLFQALWRVGVLTDMTRTGHEKATCGERPRNRATLFRLHRSLTRYLLLRRRVLGLLHPPMRPL